MTDSASLSLEKQPSPRTMVLLPLKSAQSDRLADLQSTKKGRGCPCL